MKHHLSIRLAIGLSMGLLSLAYASGAAAQSNVIIYGVIDSGITYSSNQGGKSAWQAVSGVPVGSNWGIKGSEDLGDGLSAVYKLESGFDGFTGAGYGAIFGRQSFVGLSSTKYGTLTMGHQYDSIVDFVAPYTSNGAYAGWYFSHPQDVDNTDNGVVESSSIKYKSVNYGGLTFGGLYALGGVPGSIKQNSTVSVGVNYANGPFGIGAAYLHASNPATGLKSYLQNSATFTNTVYGNYLAVATAQNILGVGGSYTLGAAKLLLSYTDTTFVNGDAGRDVHFRNLESALGYNLTPQWYLIGSYTYTFGKDEATSADPKYHQFNFMADYHLSKRTDIYAMAVFQKAAGSATVAQITGLNASDTRQQLALRVALKHSF